MDSLGDSRTLRDQAEQALREAGGTPAAPPYEGADASSSIRVTVDERARLVNVDISRQWRERLEVGGFARALHEAYFAAVGASFEAMALTAVRSEEGSPPPAAGNLPLPGPELDQRDWVRETWAVLDQNAAELRRLSEMDITTHARERTITAPRGYLTLHLRGRNLQGITGDVRRIAIADAEQLRLDALAVFQAAGLTTDH